MQTLRERIKKDIETIPDFINLKNQLHQNVFDEIQNSLALFSTLVQKKIMPPVQINNVQYEFNRSLEHIDDFSNSKDNLLSVEYLFRLMRSYFAYCEANELYEACQNIKTFFNE
jgi:hypothetical protein